MPLINPLTPKDSSDPLASLTLSERQVLEPALGGVANKVIAMHLGVSIRTVERYRASAFRRLGVETLVEAAALRAAPPVPVSANTFDSRFAAVAPSGIVDREGRVVAVNAGLCDILELSERELLGVDYSRIIHPSDRPEAARSVARLFGGHLDAPRVRRRMLRPDGDAFRAVFAVSIVWSNDGAPGFVLGQILESEPIHYGARTNPKREGGPVAAEQCFPSPPHCALI